MTMWLDTMQCLACDGGRRSEEVNPTGGLFFSACVLNVKYETIIKTTLFALSGGVRWECSN